MALAVVLTYMPDTEQTFSTPFSSDRHEDPLGVAQVFRDSEKEKGDFPGSLWAVAADDEAHEIRKQKILKALGIDG
jgi:hypothetical protein